MPIIIVEMDVRRGCKLIRSTEISSNSLLVFQPKLEDVGNNGKYLKECVEYLKTLDRTYAVVSTPLKRPMIGSIFAEKLVYENNDFRTPTFTLAVACMDSIIENSIPSKRMIWLS